MFLRRDAKKVAKLEAGWQKLSDMMRNSYNYTEYCYWCERTVLRGEGHADECEFDNALLTDGRE